jgi:hypothetical protein
MLTTIDELWEAAEKEMGADEYVRQSYAPEPSSDFKRLQERKYLGCFAKQYNEGGRAPALVWACQHERGSRHADFSVYDESKRYLCDIEITALFTKPANKNPQDYEDYSPYPVMPIPCHLSAPGVSLRDIDHPRAGFQPYATLKRVIETHLRDQYPPYWLVVYDNEHGVTHPNLTELLQRIREVLEKRAGRNRLPANLKQVWAFDWPNYGKTTLMRVWP